MDDAYHVVIYVSSKSTWGPSHEIVAEYSKANESAHRKCGMFQSIMAHMHADKEWQSSFAL
jgi:hypothetical protein